jgi:hypothetical protein
MAAPLACRAALHSHALGAPMLHELLRERALLWAANATLGEGYRGTGGGEEARGKVGRLIPTTAGGALLLWALAWLI